MWPASAALVSLACSGRPFAGVAEGGVEGQDREQEGSQNDDEAATFSSPCLLHHRPLR